MGRPRAQGSLDEDWAILDTATAYQTEQTLLNRIHLGLEDIQLALI